MTSSTNAVSDVNILTIGKNQKALSSGMKLIETYKEPSLFAQFKCADINQDGVISDDEMELYDKKELLKQGCAKLNRAKHQFKKEHAIGGLTFLGCVAGTITFPVVAPLFALAGIGSAGYLLYQCMKTNKECEQNNKLLDEQLKQLDTEYAKKIATETK